MDARSASALIGILGGDGEAHIAAHAEPSERVTAHAVLVEVDLLAVRRGEEAISLLREEARHTARRWVRAVLRTRLAALRVALQVTSGGIEGVAQHRLKIFVRVVE